MAVWLKERSAWVVFFFSFSNHSPASGVVFPQTTPLRFLPIIKKVRRVHRRIKSLLGPHEACRKVFKPGKCAPSACKALTEMGTGNDAGIVPADVSVLMRGGEGDRTPVQTPISTETSYTIATVKAVTRL